MIRVLLADDQPLIRSGFRVFVDSAAPHLVTMAVLDEEALAEGFACNEDAIDLWVQCHETGIWPGYTSEIETVSLPYYRLKH